MCSCEAFAEADGGEFIIFVENALNYLVRKLENV